MLFHLFSAKLKSGAAMRTKLKIFPGPIATVSTALFRRTPIARTKFKLIRMNLSSAAAFYILADFRIQGRNGAAARSLNIIFLIPFKQRDKKETEKSIGHKYLISAVGAAYRTDYRLAEIQFFTVLADTHNKKHRKKTTPI
jgi:hypothetical protein